MICHITRNFVGNVPYKGQNGVFLQLPNGWEVAPSDADSIGVCGAIFECTLILFSTWLCPRDSLEPAWLFTPEHTEQGRMDGTQEGWCWATAMAFTPVFLVQPASSALSAFSTLLNSRVLQGNLLEPFATTSTTLSSDPWAHHPTSSILYALSRPIPRPHELPCVSHTPGQQRHACRHLDSQT
jgi:hypothetical protein